MMDLDRVNAYMTRVEESETKTFKQMCIRDRYLVCKVLVILFLVRIFCAGFIFTPVNYERFTNSGLFPLIKAIFYSDWP